jgi:hypothetical protein
MNMKKNMVMALLIVLLISANAFSAESTGTGAGNGCLKFAVLDDTRGDMQSGIATWNLEPLFNYIHSQGNEFVVLPGDIILGCDQETNFERAEKCATRQCKTFFGSWNRYYNEVGKNVFVVRGNHECYIGKNGNPIKWNNMHRTLWQEFFGKYLPQNGPKSNAEGIDERGFTYSFNKENVFFVMIDMYTTAYDDNDHHHNTPSIFCMSDKNDKNKHWLQEQMNHFTNTPNLQHCFVFGHCPLYTLEPDCSPTLDFHPEVRDKFIATINEKVGVYFCGHMHYYDHAAIKNTSVPPGCLNIKSLHQVLVGTGGADLDWDINYENPKYDKSIAQSCRENTKMGYVQVTVCGEKVTLQFMAFNVEKKGHHGKGENFDQVRGFDRPMNEWTYTFKKKTN